MQKAPLILTLLTDEISGQYFNRLRSLHYPKYCNYVEAHLTLFHKLPADKAIIRNTLIEVCKRGPIQLEVTGLKSMGTGVAFEIQSPELINLHKILQRKFSPFLIKKDRHTLWPHITVQNKVTAFKASQTLALLEKDFELFSVDGIGIGVWLYRGKRWEKKEEYRFTG